ncbi:hypothetical protein XIS1_750010 [Xenorhabdus innexi]|uniref:Uncharacterized protein n=1 Tax=Xenorhabdus innexi TaxID=290109 RepID=A0A1N6N0V0_9GAMM|nr:hypothetical protein XIS1_750010 [Xenorhabdus innexi]
MMMLLISNRCEKFLNRFSDLRFQRINGFTQSILLSAVSGLADNVVTRRRSSQTTGTLINTATLKRFFQTVEALIGCLKQR